MRLAGAASVENLVGSFCLAVVCDLKEAFLSSHSVSLQQCLAWADFSPVLIGHKRDGKLANSCKDAYCRLK